MTFPSMLVSELRGEGGSTLPPCEIHLQCCEILRRNAAHKGSFPQTEASMPDVPRPCDSHLDLVGFKYSLPHLAQSLESQRKTRIVAIGSSSTAGADGIVPFPSRLELLLRQRSYGTMIDVINRGIGGQEAPDELSRFESDEIAEAPALVIWQVGTNAVYRTQDYNFDDVAKAIAAGLDRLASVPVDGELMGLQYTRGI